MPRCTRKQCAPHHGGGGLGFIAHLHLCAAIPNCPYVEVFHDLPGLSSDVFQWYLAEPVKLDPTDGCMAVPPETPASASNWTRKS